MKRQKNVRLSNESIKKLAILGHRYGTETTALEIAIDRMYKDEMGIPIAKESENGTGNYQQEE